MRRISCFTFVVSAGSSLLATSYLPYTQRYGHEHAHDSRRAGRGMADWHAYVPSVSGAVGLKRTETDMCELPLAARVHASRGCHDGLGIARSATEADQSFIDRPLNDEDQTYLVYRNAYLVFSSAFSVYFSSGILGSTLKSSLLNSPSTTCKRTPRPLSSSLLTTRSRNSGSTSSNPQSAIFAQCTSAPPTKL